MFVKIWKTLRCMASVNMAPILVLLSQLYMMSNGESRPFTIGLIAPWQRSYEGFSALTSASAVSIAMEKINSDPTLFNKFRLSVISRDSDCDSKLTAGNTVDLLRKERVDVIIGPPCSTACKSAAELASFFNVPIITWVATDPDFRDKDMYSTLVRTFSPFDKIGTYLVETFKSYKWTRVIVISSNSLLWLDGARAVKRVFEESNITIAYEDDYTGYPSKEYQRRVLSRCKPEGRIIVFVIPKRDRRPFMLTASELGMTRGDYVFYTIEMLPEEDSLSESAIWKGVDGRDVEARQAFESVFHVSLTTISGKELNEFRLEVARRMRIPPWNAMIPSNVDIKTMAEFTQGDKYSPFLHDAVMIYAIGLNITINTGGNVSDGATVARNMRGVTFRGMSGMCVLDSNGDREPDYTITDMQPVTGEFVPMTQVLNTDEGGREMREIDVPRWPGGKSGHEHAPPDVPKCGFEGELCKEEADVLQIVIIFVIMAIVTVVSVVGGIFIYRKKRFESSLLLLSWKIDWSDLELVKGTGSDFQSNLSSALEKDRLKFEGCGDGSKYSSSLSKSLPSIATNQQLYTDVAVYKGVMVSLKHVKKEHILLSRSVLLEFNQMKDIVHDNLNVFVGACVDPPNLNIVWHYCSKGGLQDVLQNEDLKMDGIFKISFMTDIAKGMDYLHKSNIRSHGNLKSSNCVIDARWAVKITDYGLPSFLAGQSKDETEDEKYKGSLKGNWIGKQWTSPELLRENIPPQRGTPKGDIYSYGIICFEIIMRLEPYTFEEITPRDVVNRVRNGESTPYRPALPDTMEYGKPMIDLITSLWSENPESRPSFGMARSMLRKMSKGETNIMDNMLNMMDKYTNNLEEIVEERTEQLIEEKKKTDRLIYRMLPSSVAEALKLGKTVQPESYDQATVFFSDMDGFNALTADSSPMQIVDFLNDVYSRFDDIIAKHDVYKVETIGDAYMLVSGVPVCNGSRHAAEIANVSLDLLSAVTQFRIRHRPQDSVKLRIGLHTGPVVAGVVGMIMPRYCLFGDTVNMSARMKSTSKPFRIHTSKQCYIALNDVGGYELTLRGEMDVKGKGVQTTYWLHGKHEYTKPLPTFDMAEEDTAGAHERGNHTRSRLDKYQQMTIDDGLMQSTGYGASTSTDAKLGRHVNKGMPDVV